MLRGCWEGRKRQRYYGDKGEERGKREAEGKKRDTVKRAHRGTHREHTEDGEGGQQRCKG